MYKEFFIWVLGLALVVAVAYGYAHQRNLQQRYIEFRDDKDTLDDIRAEVESLRVKVEETRARVSKMESDPLEIEATARQDARMTRDGEIIFHIEDAPPSGQRSSENDSPSPSPNE
ncbi:MAG: hypothetical protein GXY07_00960 [Candidatus Hydrogenedentes bacterium]|jgi:cell division protein FtsB|nr:hypothetical protein [Candidatus Hydrogenedentota bacterium]